MYSFKTILKDLQCVDSNLASKSIGKTKGGGGAGGGTVRPTRARFKFLCALEALAKFPIGEGSDDLLLRAVDGGVVGRIMKLLLEHPNASRIEFVNNRYVLKSQTQPHTEQSTQPAAQPAAQPSVQSAPSSPEGMHGTRTITELGVFGLSRLSSGDPSVMTKMVTQHPSLVSLVFSLLFLSPETSHQAMAMRLFVDWCKVNEIVEELCSMGVLSLIQSRLEGILNKQIKIQNIVNKLFSFDIIKPNEEDKKIDVEKNEKEKEKEKDLSTKPRLNETKQEKEKGKEKEKKKKETEKDKEKKNEKEKEEKGKEKKRQEKGRERRDQRRTKKQEKEKEKED